MRVHKGFQLVFLFEFLRCWQALLLLLLIEQHLLDNPTRLTIQVRKFGVFRLDFLSVNLFVAFKYAVPPVLAVKLGETHLQAPLSVGIALERPQRVVELNRFAKVFIDQRARLAFDFHLRVLGR